MGTYVGEAPERLNAKAFAAAAFPFGVGINEFETFVNALFNIVHLGAINIEQAFGIDDDFDAALFKDLIAHLELIDELST